MKTVRVMKIVSHDESQLRSLDELMRVFCSAKRYAFNRLLEGGVDLVTKIVVVY